MHDELSAEHPLVVSRAPGVRILDIEPGRLSLSISGPASLRPALVCATLGDLFGGLKLKR